MARRELARRIGVAAVGIPVVVAAGYAGRWALGGLLALVAAVGMLELARLAAHRGVRPFGPPGAVAAAAVVLVAAASPDPATAGPLLWRVVLLTALVLAIAAIWTHGVDGRPLAAVGVTLFGVVYLGGTLAFALFLRHLPDTRLLPASSAAWTGTALVLYPIAVTWINDTCAYFGGRAWGRRRLSPRISPNKTVEGAVAGFIGGIATGAVYAAFVFDAWQGLGLGVWAGALGGLLVTAVAQLGDLVESLFKREAGVKDSGAVFPGHGGVLDRLDALLFAFPVAYWFLSGWLGGGGLAWP